MVFKDAPYYSKTTSRWSKWPVRHVGFVIMMKQRLSSHRWRSHRAYASQHGGLNGFHLVLMKCCV